MTKLASPARYPVVCADGVTLYVTLRTANNEVRGVVQINPATAVPEGMYTAFAEYLTAQGFHTVVYNYRGMQPELPVGRGLEAGFSTWADQDVEAVTRWTSARFPELPIWAVGHSFGGHAIGLCESSQLLAGAITVASHAGCIRFVQPGFERVKAVAMLKVIGPAAARVLGYVPGSLGLGESLPGKLMLEWSRWTSLQNYFFDDPTMNASERYARPKMPVLSIGLNDDAWAPPEAISLVSDRLVNCQVERRQYGPSDSHGRAIGHLGFFRRQHSDTLWPLLAEWLKEQSPASAR